LERLIAPIVLKKIVLIGQCLFGMWKMERKIPLPKEKDNPSRPARSNNESKYDSGLDG